MLIYKTLETAVTKALYDGFVASFGDMPTSETRSMGEKFAKAAAPQIAMAIDAYIRSSSITMLPCPSVALANASGPVTGTIQAAPTFFTIT